MWIEESMMMMIILMMLLMRIIMTSGHLRVSRRSRGTCSKGGNHVWRQVDLGE